MSLILRHFRERSSTFWLKNFAVWKWICNDNPYFLSSFLKNWQWKMHFENNIAGDHLLLVSSLFIIIYFWTNVVMSWYLSLIIAFDRWQDKPWQRNAVNHSMKPYKNKNEASCSSTPTLRGFWGVERSQKWVSGVRIRQKCTWKSFVNSTICLDP